jgi:pimeloyl-ACP methyl ester carboxylesterase
MPRKKPQSKPVAPTGTPLPPTRPPTRLAQAFNELHHPTGSRQTVSARWLVSAAAGSVLAAALCGWGVLCLLFWQGSWQLLYHPSAAITRTPTAANLAFESIAFAPNSSSVPQLAGWWIPAAPDAPYTHFTVLYLHGQDGNLSAAVDDLAFLHSIGLNVFAFDYRGYGLSQTAHPSEAHSIADAAFALTYLTETRHLPPNSILVAGKSLGANVALEFAAAHPDLAGVVLDQPLDAPMNAAFNDPRAALVPAHLLVSDRYDADAAASALRVPILWLEAMPAGISAAPEAYSRIASHNILVSLDMHDPAQAAHRSAALTRWLDDLSVPPTHP